MRIALALTLCAIVAFAADTPERKAFISAKIELKEADLTTYSDADRDKLFEKLCGHDHPESVEAIADAIGQFSAYVDIVVGEMKKWQTKLAKVSDRQALSDGEIALRSTFERSLQKAHKKWTRAQESLDMVTEMVGRLTHPKIPDKVLRIFSKHSSWRVRYVLTVACGAWHKSLGNPRLSKQLFQTLSRFRSDPNPSVRASVARALGKFLRPEAFAVLQAFMKDKDWAVRAATVESLRRTKSNSAVTVLIEAMKKERGRLLDDINVALREMTGQTHDFADIWARWWEDVGRQIPEKGATKAQIEAARKKREEINKFYGIQTRSDRIVFVVDVSGSMKKPVDPMKNRGPVTGRKPGDEGPVGGKTRLEVAQNELKRAIAKLHSKAVFNIVFFSHSVKRLWPKAKQATPKVKLEARRAVEALRPAGATYTFGALRDAFDQAGALDGGATTGKRGASVDTIFLLSDGAPTDHKFDNAKLMDPQLILDAVRGWNKDLKLTIHTIAVEMKDSFFLRQLAKENGGQFVERK